MVEDLDLCHVFVGPVTIVGLSRGSLGDGAVQVGTKVGLCTGLASGMFNEVVQELELCQVSFGRLSMSCTYRRPGPRAPADIGSLLLSSKPGYLESALWLIGNQA